MDDTDKKIFIAEITRKVGQAVYEMSQKYDISEPVIIDATIDEPDCYIDDNGVTHIGRLITVCVDFAEEKDED